MKDFSTSVTSIEFNTGSVSSRYLTKLPLQDVSSIEFNTGIVSSGYLTKLPLQGVSSIDFNTGCVSSRYLTKQLSPSHKLLIQEFWKIELRHCRLFATLCDTFRSV
jgi:hypothetical protein